MTQEPSTRAPSPYTPDGNAAGGTGQGVADQAKDTAGQVVDQAKDTAGQVAEQAKQQATSQLESQKERTVGALMTVAEAVRQTGQHLHEQDQQAVGGYVNQAAERIETLTDYLRTRDVPELLADTQALARRQPGLFLTGAVALGFIGARFLKSSGRRAMSQAAGNSGNSVADGRQLQAPYASTMSAPGLAQNGPIDGREPRGEWELGVTGALET
jgi:hypothetical protein